jgi:ribosome biogenesis protein BRX1
MAKKRAAGGEAAVTTNAGGGLLAAEDAAAAAAARAAYKKQKRSAETAAPKKQQPSSTTISTKKGAAAAAAAAAPAPPAAPAAAAAPAPPATPSFKNKEKVLVLCTRGVSSRARHLMADLQALLPHAKRDRKLDTKRDRAAVVEIADLHGCSSALFFEGRKRGQDLYLWLGKSPQGPSGKFLVRNVHTTAELKLTGNHLRGSRPALSFDAAFDEQPHTQLLKELLTQVFATPRRHPRAKPFFDHVLSFSLADGHVWFRNYQAVAPLEGAGAAAARARKAAEAEGGGGGGGAAPSGPPLSLVEVGPRFCLQPVRLFAGPFAGRVVSENAEDVAPNAVRALRRRERDAGYADRVAQREARKAHEEANPVPLGALDGLFDNGAGGEEGSGEEE